MATPHLCKPQFVKILFLKDLLKLAIPTEFNKHIKKEGLSVACILSPLGKYWHVSFEQDEAGVIYFGNGWQQLVKSHNLTVGQMIVFCYEGDQIFTFIVFGLNACEVNFSTIPLKIKQEEIILEHENHSFGNVGSKRKKVCSQKKQAKKSSIRFKESLIDGVLHSTEKIVRASNLEYWQMDLPNCFCRLTGISNLDKVIIRDPKNRLWPMVLDHRNGKKSRNRLRGGWRAFASTNELKVGDKCVFEVENEGTDVILNVRILRIGERYNKGKNNSDNPSISS